ncbi:hypothetical protein I3842_14G085000 [Carya illinoinensis]|uniref:Secreted protein n=1 Tax=Carya illinoinensis TaxID=32201 RepID=A0A922AGK5_CARIL|nr:hypothetical protein I3842_14G085000 [Carya illinoinensis]
MWLCLPLSLIAAATPNPCIALCHFLMGYAVLLRDTSCCQSNLATHPLSSNASSLSATTSPLL